MRGFIKRFVGSGLQVLFSFFPIKLNKIMIETGTGEIKDHPKAFYDYVKENHIDTYDFKWAIYKGVDASEVKKSEVVIKKTFAYYYHLMTSKYWLRTHSIENIVKKRDGQIYIQMWHGPGATKKEGYDIGTIENNGEVMPHAKEWDYYVATDIVSKEYIKTALNLRIPRLLIGSCRSDRIVKMGDLSNQKLREELGIRADDKVILYAPTFREADFARKTISLEVKKLCELDGVRVILRLHPEVKNRINIDEYDGSVVDGNKFQDIYELYHVADILITDYSSVAIEYALLNKPILYYMYDLDAYSVERNFYFNYLDNLAGPIIKTEKDLIEAVLNIDKIREDFSQKYIEYNERFNSENDGHVCEKFYELLESGFFDIPGNELGN